LPSISIKRPGWEIDGGGIALLLALQYPSKLKTGPGRQCGAGQGCIDLLSDDELANPWRVVFSSQPERDLLKPWHYFYHDQDLITDQWIEQDYEMSSLPGAQRCLVERIGAACAMS